MKLPKPRKRGDRYRIEIMIDGKRHSATRDTSHECTRWAAAKFLESKARKAEGRSGEVITLGGVIDVYTHKVSVHKKGASYERMVARNFKSNFTWLSQTLIDEITPKDLTQWRNMRLEDVSGSTVLREMSFIGAVFSYAQKELFLIDSNPLKGVTKPKANKARYRRISEDEINAIFEACDYERGQNPTEPKHFVAWAFLFAIETTMRRGEILSIETKHVHSKYIHLPDTKIDESRDVPLTNQALEMLGWITHRKPLLIDCHKRAFIAAWKRAKKKSGIKNLHFQDTRHEAISRFVKDKGLPVEKLMKITGHKKAETLINVYFNPTVDELFDSLNG